VCHGALPNRRRRSLTKRHRVIQAPANTGALTARLIMPEWSNGRKGPYAPPYFLTPSLHCAPGERTKRFLNVCIFMWKRETNIRGALALVYLVDTAHGLQKLNY